MRYLATQCIFFLNGDFIQFTVGVKDHVWSQRSHDWTYHISDGFCPGTVAFESMISGDRNNQDMVTLRQFQSNCLSREIERTLILIDSSNLIRLNEM
jgi:hypothetical protein